MLTQNRAGITPLYENVPLTIDAQYAAGFNWARQDQIRFVADVNKVAWFVLCRPCPADPEHGDCAGRRHRA
jgi:hypothetical protein